MTETKSVPRTKKTGDTEIEPVGPTPPDPQVGPPPDPDPGPPEEPSEITQRPRHPKHTPH